MQTFKYQNILYLARKPNNVYDQWNAQHILQYQKMYCPKNLETTEKCGEIPDIVRKMLCFETEKSVSMFKCQEKYLLVFFLIAEWGFS